MKSHFQCIACGARYPLDEVRFVCECGDLLEVQTDFASFGRSGEAWKAQFERKRTVTAFERYRDFLLPDLPADRVVSLSEGDTPLYAANKTLHDYFGFETLYLKHEGMNPTLSFKDRGMVAGVSWAGHLGVRSVVCASTGDTSASMAAYAAQAGIRAAVLLPEGKISVEQLLQAVSYGARVLQLETDFDGCMQIVQAVTQRHDVYLLNSMNSVRIEGQKAIGLEALHQLDWEVPDYFIVPVGNAGNISALGKGIRELYECGVLDRIPRLVGVESERANPLYVSYKNGFAPLEPVRAQTTVAGAMQIGNPVSFKKAVRELKYFDGIVEQVSEDEIMDAKAVADASGIAVCPNSATALAALKKLRDKGEIGKADRVVAVMTGHGAKFSASARTYHFDTASRFSNRPTVLKADVEAVEKALGLDVG